MKGARRRAGGANGPRGFSDDELCPENIYKIYDEATKESSEEQSNKFKERFKERFKEKFNEGSNIITQDQFSIISIFEEMFKKRVEAITQDQFSEIFSDKKIDLLFDQLNSANLEEHLSMINQNKWQTYNSDDKIPENLQKNDREPPRESWGEETYKKLCFSCYFYRSRNLKDQPKNLTELLKKINPYCDPSEEKIKKVLEEYKIYKELHSGEEALPKKQECKTSLKQAIDVALKTNILILPTIDLAKSIRARYDLEKKIDLSLNSQSDKPPNPGSAGIILDLAAWYQPSESKSISPDALESILFHNELMDENEAQIKMPKRKLTSVDEFKNFLAENGGTNLDENKVKEAFNAYKIYYNTTLGQSDISVKLKKSQEIQSNGVSDHEFNGIVSFLDRMPEAELNVSLVTQPSIKLIADESNAPAQSITVVDIKRDKVAEFKKFLENNNLNCTDDNIQKVFALHELYEAYEAFGKIDDREDATEISSNTKKRLRDQIEKILLPNATEQSVQQENDITKKEMPDDMLQEVPKSSIKIEKEGKDSEIGPYGKPNDAKIDEILKYLSEHNKQKKQDNEATDQLNSAQKSNLNDLRKNNVLQFLNFKFPLFTNSRNKKIIDFYEKYASEPEEDKKLKFKVEFIMAIADGINVQNNINALDTLKTLDALNKNNIDDIKKAEGEAKQEEPNEIIKFFVEIPSNILRAFGCIRTVESSPRGKQPNTRE